LLAQQSANIRFEWRHFPLQSIHIYGLPAAMAAECAADQGKFWEFVDLAFEKQTELNIEQLSSWAKELGLDMDVFDRCLRSEIKKDAVWAEYNEGRDRGVSGTPTFFVNGQRVDSSLEAITTAINEAGAGFNQRL
ncbi:MAG TPA: thioredoxin domain-containing protein, partial [Candidatus Peribacteraceae bacterium]|nr:thioredoxin domain-containing protein [Candidatus Peribacteraceae bacterium]